MNILELKERKRRGEKLVMLTCYDAWSAKILSRTDVDMLLVGDSVAMVVHGEDSTLPADVPMMAAHTRMVARGAGDKFIVADLPFLSYRGSRQRAMDAVAELMRSGAHAVKLEGIGGNRKIIRRIVGSGVPVMAHLGLTPQSVNALGGFRVQGREPAAREKLLDEACQAQELGCFALVLECVPAALAAEISQRLEIPVIGIGAGQAVDGQVLVFHDLLGLAGEFQPRFLRRYLNGGTLIREAVNTWVEDTRGGRFPALKETYQ